LILPHYHGNYRGYRKNTAVTITVSLSSTAAALAPNPARNLAGAGHGRISKKCPDSGFAEAGAKIRYKPINE